MSAELTPPLDEAKSEAFAEQMLGVLNSGALSSFPPFQRLMAEDSAQIFDASLVQTTLPSIPGLVERLRAGIDVADIGCGSGHAINLMAQAFPHSRFVGYDISEEGIAAAHAEAKRLGLTNARFEVQDVSPNRPRMPLPFQAWGGMGLPFLGLGQWGPRGPTTNLHQYYVS